MPCILIVEDETMVGLDLRLQLEDEGFQCLGPVPTVQRALAVLETHAPDAGVLDANLCGDSSAPVAVQLLERGTPFVYVSGHSDEHFADALPRAPLLKKPVRMPDLISTLRRVLEEQAKRRASDDRSACAVAASSPHTRLMNPGVSCRSGRE